MADVFLEEGAFYIHMYTTELAPGRLALSMTFERKSDFTEGKSMIPGMRHLVEDEFPSTEAALKAGEVIAAQKIKDDETGV